MENKVNKDTHLKCGIQVEVFVKNGSIIRGKNCRIIQWNFLQKLFVFPVLIQPGIELSEQIDTLIPGGGLSLEYLTRTNRN